MNYQDINARTIDAWVRDGWQWGRPISHEEYQRALQGDWQLFLTPTKAVPREWFGELQGCRLLGLASGGAQQMPIFAARGARCTVLDYSPLQLESERRMAQAEGYGMEIIRADMTQPLPFAEESFDLIFHPVSNCYVREVEPIFRECYRILKPGGRLLGGFDTGMNFALDEQTGALVQRLPYDPIAMGLDLEQLEREGEGVQFSHTVEEQIGAQLKAGFTLRALYEDSNGYGILHDYGIPSFVATLAVKQQR